VTVHDDLLFILNSWDQGNIYGYRIRSGDADDGSDFALIPLPNSKRILNSFPFGEPRLAINTQFGFPGLTAHEASSQVGLSPDGGWLVVVNKGADPNVGPSHEGSILVYSVDPKSGLPSIDPVHNTSTAGNIRPFSFIWLELAGETIMLLTEADGPSASSYRFSSRTGALTPISENVGNGNRLGLCWNAYHPRSDVMFGTNAPDSSISSYRVNRRGELVLLESVAFSYGDKFTAFPFDVTIVGDFLYTVQAGTGSVAAFQINPRDGSLALATELIAFDAASADLIQNNGLIGLFGGTAGGLAAMRLSTSVEGPISDNNSSSTSRSSSRTKHRKMLPRAAAAAGFHIFIASFAFWLYM
jgi:6-phosphogluconolactonase (cycloisomerase 2 family)